MTTRQKLLSFLVASAGLVAVSAADLGLLRTGVRVWYVGGVNTDFYPQMDPGKPEAPPWTSDAEAAALIDRIEGGVPHILRWQAVRNWTSPMPVEDLPVLAPESEGPFWISPDRLGALRPSHDTITWQDLQWLVSARASYRDALPFLNLLPEQALLLTQPGREIVTLDTVSKIPGLLGSDISVGTAYFDVDTGLLLSRTDTLTAPGAKYVRTMLTLSEINYDFASRQAYAEDSGPHSGFSGFFAASRHEFLQNQSVQFVSAIVSRYKNALVANLSGDLGNTGNLPQTYHSDQELFYDADTETAAVRSSGSPTWQVNGDHLFWWIPPAHLGTGAIQVWDLALGSAGSSGGVTSFTATSAPANPAFPCLVFGRDGYLTDMAVTVPAMAIAVDSRSDLNKTIRIDGLAFYQSVMHGLASPSSQPLITPRCQLTIPPDGSARMARDGFRLLLAGEANRDYVTEYSDELIHWWPLATNHVANANLAVEIVDPQATNLMKRFYRGRSLR